MKNGRTSAVRRAPWVIAAAIFLFTAPTAPLFAQPITQTLCAGDCNGDREVTVDELITGVNIALGRLSADDCPAFDRNNDGSVSIDELVQAVNRALDGCMAVDCAALEKAVDERWGDAPDVETRLEHFDSLWAYIGSTYAGFATLPSLDWDEVRDTYRPQFESAESYGRLFALTAELMHLVHDLHTVIWSKKVCDTPRSERPPLFARYDYPYVASENGSFGVCGTPLEDDRLLVYYVEPDNPAGLEPGDLILGYDGEPWRALATALEACDIPTCGYYRAAATADHRLLMSAVMFNAHLFQRLDVQRYGSTEIESIPTDDLLAYKSTLECAEQIAPDGVELPWTDYEMAPAAGPVSWGRLEGNIGYIYVFAWGGGGAALFDSAVAELMDTDGLIIDMRNHSGGAPPVSHGTALLFGEDVPSVLRPHIRPAGSDYDVLVPFGVPVSVVADPTTFYDRPIAVLTGPKTQSGGDVSSFVYSKHPRARCFGRAASGDFGAGFPVGLYTPVAGVADDFVGLWYPLPSVTGSVYLDSEGQVMLRSEQTPETEVWFTQDDVAAGRDTVVEAALAWIADENGAIRRLPAPGTATGTGSSKSTSW